MKIKGCLLKTGVPIKNEMIVKKDALKYDPQVDFALIYTSTGTGKRTLLGSKAN